MKKEKGQGRKKTERRVARRARPTLYTQALAPDRPPQAEITGININQSEGGGPERTMKFLCAVAGGLDQRKSFFLLSSCSCGVEALIMNFYLAVWGGGPGLDWSGLVVGLWWACGGLWWACGGLWWAFGGLSVGFRGLLVGFLVGFCGLR